MNNRPVPVKLLPVGSNRTQLLIAIGERNVRFNQNDYIEKLAGRKAKEGELGKGQHAAITLLAIENASEIAKSYLHATGMFEKMMGDVIGTRENMTYQVKSSKNNLNIQRKSGAQENFILVEQKFGNGTGHYGLIHLKHRNGQVNVYDSMYDSDLSNFVNVAKKWAPQARSWESPKVRSILGCKAKYIEGWSLKLQVQPTGGFVASNYNNFLNANHNGYGIRIKRQYGETVAKGAYKLSQFDEMSQHHFCYMESIYAMMLAVGLTNNPGPNDPRKRIAFIKKFIWGMIHKYTPRSKRGTAKWKYFSKTFPYIMATQSKTGKSLRLFRGATQLPDNNGEFTTKTLKMSWSGYDKIDPSWSLEDVLGWVHTGRSPRGNRNANSNSNSNNNNNLRNRRSTNNNIRKKRT